MELNRQKKSQLNNTKIIPWTFLRGKPGRVRQVKMRLKPYEVTAPKHVAVILAVLDQHGLFHEVITPMRKIIGKEIKRRAKRLAKAFQKRITDILHGRKRPVDALEANLALRWEERGEDRIRLEKLKVMSETFQINRGGRIIPRNISRKCRMDTPQGPRSEPEITHALQILDRYLKEECSMRPQSRRECLGSIFQSAMDLRDSPESVVERIRWRLRNAKTPLDNVDYYEATGVSYKLNDDKQEMFWKCQNVFYSPESVEEQENAEDTMEKLFSFKEVLKH